MNPNSHRNLTGLLAGAALVAWLQATAAQAVVVHQYTFNNGNVNDSVGTAHGTVVDPGAATAAFTIGGQLDLSGNAGQGSNGITNDAYVDLPNGIVSAAAMSGTSGAVSFEFWATVATQRTWQRFGDFGTSNDGEDTSASGTTSPYMLITPNSGRFTNGLEITNHAATGPEPNVGLTGPFPVGVEQHVVAVYDHNNTLGGVNPNGTMSLYLQGALVGTGVIDPGFSLNTLPDVNNWLGRSQWNDPVFDGFYNEFRVYDHPLTAAEVTTSFNTGPVAVPLPTLIVNTVTGATAIRNLSPSAVTIDYYEVTSAAGRLNPTGWSSLSDQNIDAGLPADFNGVGGVNAADLTVWRSGFGTGTTKAQGDADGDADVDGDDLLIWQQQFGQSPGEGDSWDEAGGSNNSLLAELFLNGATTIQPNGQLSLGNAFTTGAAGDLVFQFALQGQGSLTTGLVQYVTTGPATAVPEPTTALLGGLAAAVVVGLARRRGLVR